MLWFQRCIVIGWLSISGGVAPIIIPFCFEFLQRSIRFIIFLEYFLDNMWWMLGGLVIHVCSPLEKNEVHPPIMQTDKIGVSKSKRNQLYDISFFPRI